METVELVVRGGARLSLSAPKQEVIMTQNTALGLCQATLRLLISLEANAAALGTALGFYSFAQ